MFFDRERELKELMNLITYEPNMIIFVYGPINSGKTTLMEEFIGRLSDKYVTFSINLRGRFIPTYEEFINVMFSIKKESMAEIISEIIKSGLAYRGIPVPESILRKLLKYEEDPFVFLEGYFNSLKEKGKIPILILDELQVIGDLKIDGPFIYSLFNFFIRLTKELHLAHVFVITSDSLFLEKIYGEAMLYGRADYFLVDDLDKNTTLKFLKELGLEDEEAEFVWSYFGGKPVYLIEAVKHRDRLKEWCEKQLRIRTQMINSIIDMPGIADILREFLNKETIPFDGKISEPVRELVRKNVLFVDLPNGVIKPQGRLELLAIRNALKRNTDLET
ncbi:ATP-binding protein [Pyrococcus kukulkanii]|uniref:ATP-binding protein n=1 Tax=Pyrococcus kukulkanii TaxID=1609559 RepID=A0A127BBY6_9EURY|nr:ATP-binding protein [Pyrococcus kukulkanii]AMM54848.1 ATP-binding protein [Pyrococcus kukulkanii]